MEKNKEFKTLQNSVLGFNTDTIWLKLEIHSENPNPELSIQFNEASYEFIELYQENKRLYGSTEKVLFNPIVSPLTVSGTKPIFIKAKFHNHVYFNLKVIPVHETEIFIAHSLFGNGWYYGFVFMVIVVNLFFYFSLKNTPFLSYAIFIGFINLGISQYDGMLNLWVDLSSFEKFIPLIHFIISLTGFWFASGFLNLDRSHPRAKHIAYIFLTISAIFFTLYMVTGSFIYMAFGDLFAYLVLILYWFMGVLVFKKHEFAKFFVLGYALIMFAGLFHLIPLNFGGHLFPLSYSIVKTGGVFEMLILSFAITYRVKTMQEENNKIKDDLNSYMDQVLSLEERLQLDQPNTDQSTEIMAKINGLASQFDLTDREVDVLLCIANQNTNSQIADQLFISVNTVKYHTRNIYQKLNIKNKSDAISLVSQE